MPAFRGRLGACLALAVALAWPAQAVAAHAELTVTPALPHAGEPAELQIAVKDSAGRNIRFLQFVHERPMHLIVVSRDLADFAHVHPELGFDDAYHLEHVFPRAGTYRLFADYTPPGSGTRVDPFDVTVAGDAAPVGHLVPDRELAHTASGVRVQLAFDHAPRAGDDLKIAVTLSDSASGAPITDLQLYLGALAHFILVSEDLRDFIHAHPSETGNVIDPSQDPNAHVHDPAQLAKLLAGPSPATIHAVTGLPHAGRYKLWVQFQRAGDVVTVPFVFSAAPAAARAVAVSSPAGAIRIAVGAGGYSPARIELRRGETATLAFSRPDAGNCGGMVVIPALGVKRELPAGGTTLIRVTPDTAGEIPFRCGTGMLQGVLVVR